ncbi:MAG: nuclear transport factor 2 family protein [Rhodoferax sp.]|uniref:nuclear transport factor 2 family protein n=1 Tax=Rhodoferax sp. TaxID=50421 RepID=UPI00272FFEF2|nr:nuclear transport factor 2 family protein [Rhodoferax sp.]MDP1530505.1 nuclear transport factor 2 family protein [Rhodoferax sp.]
MSDGTRAAVDRLCVFFESISPQSVSRMGEFYTANARFKDPFNEVHGVPAIQRVFAHMFVSLHAPRFVVTGRIVDGTQCFLVWEFRFRFKRFDTTTEQVVRGGSHLLMTEDGLIQDHRDYWDAAEELYEKLPVVGSLMRWLKQRANS